MRRLALAFGAVLAAGLTGASAPPSVEAQILAESQALCVATHADPARVYAAATRAGYTHLWQAGEGDQGDQDIAVELTKPNAVFLMTKQTGDDEILLRESQKTGPMFGGPTRLGRCTMGFVRARSSGMHAALTARFGRGPNNVTDGLEEWYFTETSAGPRLLPAMTDQVIAETLAHGPLKWLSIKPAIDKPTLLFGELTRTGPPLPPPPQVAPQGAFVVVAPAPGYRSSAPHPSVITNPQWVRKPTNDDFNRFYPPDALERHVEGHTTIDCLVTDEGLLKDCSVTEEAPPGEGFGNAALRTASRYKMRPETVDGAPVGGAHVRVPHTWRLEQ